METNNDNIELIDRFINNELSGDELEAFESQLEKDANFRDLVETQRLAISQIRHHAALKKMKKIGAALEKNGSNQKKQPRIRRLSFIVGIAASFLALFIIGYAIRQHFIEKNRIVQTPSNDIDTDKYGTDSQIDFNETLAVKHLNITDGAVTKIPRDRKISLTILFDKIPEAYYDFRAVNNDLFILIDKETLNSKNPNPALFQIINKDDTQLFLRFNEDYYLISDGEKQLLIKEEDETILNILEKH